MKTKSKDGRLLYEMILAWNTPKRPFITQKLKFKAGPQFSLAYKEAKMLKDLLWKSGGLKKSAVKLLSVSVAGVLEDFQRDNGVYLNSKKEEMNAQIKRFMQNEPSTSIPAKRALKAKPIKRKDTISFSIGGEKPKKKKKHVKSVTPKVKIMPMPNPMIDATKANSKVKKKKAKKK